MATPMVFKQGEYVAGKFDNSNANHLTHSAGTIYLATTNLYTAHLLYDDGTNFLEVVPRMLGYHNGGVGVDLTSAPSNAVFIQNSTQNGMTHVATANGALYATSANGTPQFGTLPVKQGGTGKTSFTKYGVVYGNSSSALKVTAAGGAGTIFVGADSAAPKFVTPAITWTAGTTEGPIFKLTIDATDFTATIPSASETASGIVTNAAQTFGGHKTFANGITINGQAKFNGGFQVVGGTDAYYNSSSDNSVGSLEVIGGITSTMNMRVDGGTVQFKKAGKIQYDDTKDCFNFVFM